jgi:predicted site-specific integrase-resolvase
MGDDKPETMLTAKDVARILGVGVETVRRRARRGDIEAKLLMGRAGFRFFPKDVYAYQHALKPACQPTSKANGKD